MRDAVQPNPDLRQVAILENSLRKEDDIGVYSYSIYTQRIRDAADNYDAFSKVSGGKSLHVRYTRIKLKTQYTSVRTCTPQQQWPSKDGHYNMEKHLTREPTPMGTDSRGR